MNTNLLAITEKFKESGALVAISMVGLINAHTPGYFGGPVIEVYILAGVLGLAMHRIVSSMFRGWFRITFIIILLRVLWIVLPEKMPVLKELLQSLIAKQLNKLSESGNRESSDDDNKRTTSPQLQKRSAELERTPMPGPNDDRPEGSENHTDQIIADKEEGCDW